MSNSEKYTYSVAWSEEDGEYVGLCAQFPYLSFLSPVPDAALAGVRESVAIALDMLAADGGNAPKTDRQKTKPVCV